MCQRWKQLYIWTNCHKSTDWTFKRTQKCICLNIERLERYSTKDCLTPYLTIYHSTTCSSSNVLNPNYVIIVKQDINKLLIVGFIKSVDEATRLFPIVVVLKKKGKLKICVVLGYSMQQQIRTLTHCLSQMKSSTQLLGTKFIPFWMGFQDIIIYQSHQKTNTITFVTN
jgi:hypothetical protein